MTAAAQPPTRPEPASAILCVRGLRVAFAGLKAVDGAEFDVEQGRITALIGPNGAGKTTTFNLIAGALRPDAGSILFRGHEIAGVPTHVLARGGLTRTFQLSRNLGQLTVIENLALYHPDQPGERLFDAILGTPRARRAERAAIEAAFAMAEELHLTRVANNLAADLSGGQKKLLEIGRALMAGPDLLLLDEPMAGVTPALGAEIAELLLGLRRRGLTILLVEHNVGFVRRVSDRVIVLAGGRVLAEGSFDQIRRDEAVQLAYLGRPA